MADDKDHFIYLDSSVGAGMDNAIAWVTSDQLDPTRIDTHTITNPTGSTDVEVVQGQYSGTHICGVPWSTLVGWTACMSLATSGKCDRHIVHFNSDNVAEDSVNRKRWAACHELGHSLGLMHDANQNSCMWNSYYSAPNTYSQHDRDMFYNYY